MCQSVSVFGNRQPEGGKVAPHHILTLPSGSCGGVYVDPLAVDGFRFKLYGHQSGRPVFQAALADPKHRWHGAAKRAGTAKPYMSCEPTLASRDGLHWDVRFDWDWGLPDWHPEPFIPTNPPGEHGCGGIECSCLVETDDELRIYSSGSKVPHGKNFPARQTGLKNVEAILLHTLRKDGFLYLASRGNWARFITKPLVLLGGNLTMNAQALFGKVAYQLTDMESQPIEGFTLDDCDPFTGDSLDWPLQWRGKPADELTGKIVRLEVRFRQARLYAFRGNFHFIDAQDRSLLLDNQPIDPSRFDF